MPLRRLAREAWEVPRDLLLGRYPEFVTGGPLARGDVPVFVFHSLEPESFERKLRHLSENGYVALSAEEYFRVLVGAGAAPERGVVLTFDDGRGSLWSVGFPLMRRYGTKGIVFLVPGSTRSRPGPPAPTWEEVEAGRIPAEEVRRGETEEGSFLSWEEIDVLSRSGLFDFQSHTLFHARVHAGPALAGFVTPARRRGYAALDVPLIRDGDRDLRGEEIPLGTPVLESAPRTSEVLRFLEDPAVRRGCVEAVNAEGGAAFFQRRGWEARLRRLLGRRAIAGRRETPAEREAAIRTELAESKRLIEERTDKPVIHLAYPWHASGPTARRLSLDVGYRTAFGGKVAGVPITRAGGDLQHIARIGEDYLELLPGRGRVDLSTVLYRKWSRRLRARA